HRRQRVLRPIADVFEFFADAHNLDLLTPPWLHFRVITPAPIRMEVGTLIEYSIRWRIIRIPWLTRIEEWSAGSRFVDVQLRGPYRLWHHTHNFEHAGDETWIEDIVRYALPGGALGRLAHSLVIRRDIERIFDYRADQIARRWGGANVKAAS